MPAPCTILDVHAHINGPNAAKIWREVAGWFGISKVWTQVRLEDCATVREILGDGVEFIAFPNFRAANRRYSMTDGYLSDIQQFHSVYGARMVKFWNAPRLREVFPSGSGADIYELDGAARIEAAKLAESLGMMFMVHLADPDTWFNTRYADSRVYGRKVEHYRGFEVMLDRFAGPWLAAHMGGWPESLDFLDGLLTRHGNLYLDTSATKWVVRELGGQDPARVRDFFIKWEGRILFGSDIVSTEEHLKPSPEDNKHPMADLANSPESARELYASRYFALRTLFETSYDGESPIADPDLMMVDPSKYDARSAPRIRGCQLPPKVLKTLYHDAAAKLFAKA